MRLFPFYFCNIALKTDLLTFGVASVVFGIAGEMRRLPAYFDNPDHITFKNMVQNSLERSLKKLAHFWNRVSVLGRILGRGINFRANCF